MKIECCQNITRKIGLNYITSDCEFAPKFKVRYKCGIRGEIKEVYFCKRHYNAFIKNTDRIKKITGFNSEVSLIESL